MYFIINTIYIFSKVTKHRGTMFSSAPTQSTVSKETEDHTLTLGS